MKAERIRDNLFVYRCTNCTAPLFICFEESAASFDHDEALCFNCFSDRCQVAEQLGATHLHAEAELDAIADSDLNALGDGPGPQAVGEALRHYKKKLNNRKAAEAEADIEDLF